MDVTSILAVVCSAIVFLAWFVLPGTKEKPGSTVVTPAETLPTEVAA
ncbi:MAG: hypothetical protein QOE92_1475 [Chloroflexota bacterium]|jgi:hypothetical protein|nr:hypothetical protein [Chloroflexota bacterium]